MRIGVVARCLNTAHIRGMGRYVYDVISEDLPNSGINWLLFGDDPRYPMTAPPGMSGLSDVFTFRGDRFQLWEQIGLPRRARQHGVDVLHCTEGTLPWWQPVPTVVTLHDTIAWRERDGSAFTDFYMDRLLPAALARCAAVITISDSSRRDILAMWPRLESKLSVIPHGIGSAYLNDNVAPDASAVQASMRSKPFVVYLGGPLPRKRFDWALKVLDACPVPDLQMIACGFGGATRQAATDMVPAQLRPRVHLAPFLSDSELLALYRGAGAVLYPTLYEGFGFPAIEAQAAGTPVVFSAVSSLTELVGPLATVVPTEDLGAWATAVAHAVTDHERRASQAPLARAWARRFSWQVSYEAHLSVYQRAAGV